MEAALYWITCWSVYKTAQCYKSVHKLNNHCSEDLTARCYLLFCTAWPLWMWEYWDVCILFCIRMSREIWNWDSSICKLYFPLLSLVIINKYAGDWNLLHWSYIVLIKNYHLLLQLLFKFVEWPLLDVHLN